MKISDFYYKKLGKMINDPNYDLNVKFSNRLLDLGFITLERGFSWHMSITLHYSYFKVTDLGKQVYEEWKKRN